VPKVFRSRRLLALVVTGAVVVVAYAVVLPRIAGYGAVWRDLRHLGWTWSALLALATLANLATFAPPWMVALPGLGFLNALSMTQASTALGLVAPGGAPVGMASSYAMLRSWGFAGRPVARAVAVTGIWNQLSTFLFPIVAVALLAVEGTGSHTAWVLGVVAAVLFVAIAAAVALVLGSPKTAYRIGELARSALDPLQRVLRRPPPVWSGEALVRFRDETIELIRRRRLALTIATAANQLTGFLILDFSLRALGISRHEVSIVESFAAWSLGRLIVSLPLTPGGVGFVELGLTATLIGFGGPNSKVVAAVLVYRALSVIPTLALGLLAAATWRAQRPRLPAEAGE